MVETGKENEWKQYESTIQRFIQAMAKNMKLYEITPSIGRLYGVLYFSDEPMTLDEMGQALDMSKTSMSTGVRTLSGMNMVESTFRKGIRKDLYQSEEDWYKSFTSLFGNRWRKLTETNLEAAEAAIQTLKEIQIKTDDQDLVQKIEKDLQKIYYAKNYYEWLMNFIHVIETGKIFDYIPKPAE